MIDIFGDVLFRSLDISHLHIIYPVPLEQWATLAYNSAFSPPFGVALF